MWKKQISPAACRLVPLDEQPDELRRIKSTKGFALPASVRRESEHAVIAHRKKDQSGDCEDGDNGMVQHPHQRRLKKTLYNVVDSPTHGNPPSFVLVLHTVAEVDLPEKIKLSLRARLLGLGSTVPMPARQLRAGW